MQLLRWAGLAFGGLVAVLLAAAGAARFSDGPLGPLAGGPLVAGSLVEEPVLDWDFVADTQEIELQLLNPPRSRTTWILAHEGHAYIPCGVPNFRLWKQWPHEAVKDGRAIVRLAGKRYPVVLRRVDDPELRAELVEALQEKYPVTRGYSFEVWIFELRSRAA